jgi:cytochrome P450
MDMPTRTVLSAEALARLQSSRVKESQVLLPIDIYDCYRQQLAGPRVAYLEQKSAWGVFRYADVQQVMLDTETFSSQRAYKPDGSVDEILGAGMLGTDPPRHRHLRSLAVQAFTQKRVAQLEPRIRQITADLLDACRGRNGVDLVEALAFPLPVTVIGELLGVPKEDYPKFHRWAEDFISTDFALRRQTGALIAAYFIGIIAEKTRHPQEDLISELIQAKVDGAALTGAEVAGMCLLLLIAGHETTMSLIGNALWCLEENPLAQEELVAHPELIPNAIEEVLRYRAVVHYFVRVVKRDIRFADQELKEGDLVAPYFAAANRDAAQFPDPHRFDIHRTPNRHLGFGYGIHLCLGASLARLETKIALTELLARYPKLKRDPASRLELRPSPLFYSLREYRVALGG